MSGHDVDDDDLRAVASDFVAAVMLAAAGGSWRRATAYTLFRAPGCYAFQLDGTTFSKVVVFTVAH